MSNQKPFGGRAPNVSASIPRGEIVASYESYGEAQAAVDSLAHADFPVAQVSIVGNDLKSVERVIGKQSYARAAISGALSGLWLGLFFGFFLVILSPTATSLPFIAAASLIGAGFGLLFRVVTYSISRRRRDFTSTMQVIATSYSLVVSPDVANKARNVLER
ncbi:general stress protein [Agreia sp.]|uniref:general stress protein n=1 Tax=Agreia sp. TaxID=1872416 RepID=UPI0035BC428D